MNERNRFLIIDCETGGIDADKHSILTIAGIGWEPGKEINTNSIFNISIKEHNLNIDPEAIKVNNINLNDIVMYGLPPGEAVNEIVRAITFWNATEPVILAGHNVSFDIAFLKRLFRLANRNDFKAYFSHRSLDTASIFKFLQISKMVDDFGNSSNAFFKFCNVEIKDKDRHTAKGDALATAQSLEYLYYYLLKK